MQYARILYRHSYPPFVPVLICPLFPHTKNNPTPYFAHFLKEILRMRAHSREGNIKGNSLGRGSILYYDTKFGDFRFWRYGILISLILLTRVPPKVHHSPILVHRCF